MKPVSLFLLLAIVFAAALTACAEGDAPMSKVTNTANSPYARLDAVPVGAVTLSDSFWKPKRDVNHASTIPHQYAECERTGRIDNFRRAAGRETLYPHVKLSGHWGISAKDRGHAIFEGLGDPLYFVSEGVPTRDICCWWDDAKDVSGTWLADWENPGGRVVCGEYTRGDGKAIFVGTGAFFWHTAGAANACRGDLEKFTGNVLAYLGGGPVAFLGAAPDAAGLGDEAKAALDWLRAGFDTSYVPFADVEGLGKYKTAWWHFAGKTGLPGEALDAKSVKAVKAFLKRGGGLFLSGLAPQYLVTLGLEQKAPTTIRQTPEDGFRGYYFNDSDVYKWMEAAAYSLASYPDPALDKQLDDLIEVMAAAQGGDGYLNTYFMFENEGQRWRDLTSKHELYCGGHMIQAAVAHHRVTGKTSFLDIATKWADLVCQRFGPGKEHGTPGHPEPEMALVELYRDTGDGKYLDLASFFIEERGKGVLNDSPYLQDHLPIREQTYVTGHAVRQLYLTAGVADVYAETGDPSLLDVLLKQWDDFASTKMYVTGGAGALHKGEAFGAPYELPNGTAYAETCAAIASFMWNWRMLQITADAKYADVMEQALYNGLLSGVSLDGKEYFYVNPLDNDGGHRRTTKHFDGCACCPPNVARTLAALPGHVYATAQDALYIHHYVQSEARITLGKRKVLIKQQTQYPWEGLIQITVEPEQPATFTIHARYPSWADQAIANVNGERMEAGLHRGSYIQVRREWAPGDTFTLVFPMPVRKVMANPRVEANVGRVALMRGPIVYCFEQPGGCAADMGTLMIPGHAPIRHEYRPSLLGGVTVLECAAIRSPLDKGLGAGLDELRWVRPAPAEIEAIPYFAWANRESGPMRVWLPVF